MDHKPCFSPTYFLFLAFHLWVPSSFYFLSPLSSCHRRRRSSFPRFSSPTHASSLPYPFFSFFCSGCSLSLPAGCLTFPGLRGFVFGIMDSVIFFSVVTRFFCLSWIVCSASDFELLNLFCLVDKELFLRVNCR